MTVDAPESTIEPATRKRPRRGVIVALVVGVLLVVVVVAVAVLFFWSTASTTYNSKAYGYSVRFPGQPTISTGTTPAGHPRERAEWSDGAGNVIAIEAARLSQSVPSAAVASVLKASLADSVTAVGGSDVHSVSTRDLNGVPARSEQYNSSQLGSAFELVAIKGSTIYVVTIAQSTPAEQASIEKSFAFTG
jgi:hypothetical protein